MTTPHIEIERHDRVCILRCRGRFVAGPDIDYVQARLDDIKRIDCVYVLADFSDVPWVGSMGLNFIAGVYSFVVCQSGGRFVVTGVVPAVRRVLDLTRLSTVVPLADDVASGLMAMNRADSAACSEAK